MKKLLYFLAVVAISHTSGFAQGCLPEGITFTTQSQVDSFPINYPGCTIIEGNVTIWGTWDITNLTALNSLTSVGGNFTINDSHALDDFTGLDNLQSVAGNVLIKNNIYQVSFNGLQNLTTIGGNFDTYQYYNTTLTNFQGLNGLSSIGGNFTVTIYNVLNNFSGLENLTSIGGTFTVFYTSTVNFSGLDSLSSIGGNLSISGNLNLMNVSGLQGLSSIGTHLYINSCPRLSSLAGLLNLTYVGGNIDIYSNDSLTMLYGMDNIAAGTIDNLSIRENHMLSTCEVKSVCDYLAAPNGTIDIHNNAPGCNSPEEVEAACHVGVESITGSGLNIFPNPTTGLLTIEAPGTSIKSQLTILNLSGQEILEKIITEPTTQLDISQLSAGIYVVRLADESTVRTAKLVKQ